MRSAVRRRLAVAGVDDRESHSEIAHAPEVPLDTFKNAPRERPDITPLLHGLKLASASLGVSMADLSRDSSFPQVYASGGNVPPEELHIPENAEPETDSARQQQQSPICSAHSTAELDLQFERELRDVELALDWNGHIEGSGSAEFDDEDEFPADFETYEEEGYLTDEANAGTSFNNPAEPSSPELSSFSSMGHTSTFNYLISPRKDRGLFNSKAKDEHTTASNQGTSTSGSLTRSLSVLEERRPSPIKRFFETVSQTSSSGTSSSAPSLTASQNPGAQPSASLMSFPSVSPAASGLHSKGAVHHETVFEASKSSQPFLMFIPALSPSLNQTLVSDAELDRIIKNLDEQMRATQKKAKRSEKKARRRERRAQAFAGLVDDGKCDAAAECQAAESPDSSVKGAVSGESGEEKEPDVDAVVSDEKKKKKRKRKSGKKKKPPKQSVPEEKSVSDDAPETTGMDETHQAPVPNFEEDPVLSLIPHPPVFPSSKALLSEIEAFRSNGEELTGRPPVVSPPSSKRFQRTVLKPIPEDSEPPAILTEQFRVDSKIEIENSHHSSGESDPTSPVTTARAAVEEDSVPTQYLSTEVTTEAPAASPPRPATPPPLRKRKSALNKIRASSSESVNMDSVNSLLIDIPEFQHLVCSSLVLPDSYADVLDCVVKTLNYTLCSAYRKSDYSGLAPFLCPRRHGLYLHHYHRPNRYGLVRPSTTGSFHIIVRRSSNSVPLTAEHGLKTLSKSIRASSSIALCDLFSAGPSEENFRFDRVHQDKAFGRIENLSIFGAFSMDSELPYPACVVARGGFGTPVLRLLMSATDMELIGVRYVGGLTVPQAKMLVPYPVGHRKWSAAMELLVPSYIGVWDDFGGGGLAADREHARKAEPMDGFFVFVIRKVGALDALAGMIDSFKESFKSLFPAETSEGMSSSSSSISVPDDLMSNSILSAADRLDLSLLVPRTAERIHSTMTLLFKDSEFIPTMLDDSPLLPPNLNLSRSHPSNIPRTLITPPPYFPSIVFLRLCQSDIASPLRHLALLMRELDSAGFLILGCRSAMLTPAFARRLLDESRLLPVDSVSGGGASGGGGGKPKARTKDSVKHLNAWFTAAPVVALSVWRCNAVERLNNLVADLNRSPEGSAMELYAPSTFRTALSQTSIMFPEGQSCEVTHTVGTNGEFSRSIIAREISGKLLDSLLKNAPPCFSPHVAPGDRAFLELSPIHDTLEENVATWASILESAAAAGASEVPEAGGINFSGLRITDVRLVFYPGQKSWDLPWMNFSLDGRDAVSLVEKWVGSLPEPQRDAVSII